MHPNHEKELSKLEADKRNLLRRETQMHICNEDLTKKYDELENKMKKQTKFYKDREKDTLEKIKSLNAVFQNQKS